VHVDVRYGVGGTKIYTAHPEHRYASDWSHIPDIRTWRGECFYGGFRWSNTDLFQTGEDVERRRQPSSCILFCRRDSFISVIGFYVFCVTYVSHEQQSSRLKFELLRERCFSLLRFYCKYTRNF
jgi:hypothetical protein